MSAVDQAAPTRIWADQDKLTWVEECPGERMKDDEVEYIRADLVEAADMAECAAFFAGYDAGEAGRADLAAHAKLKGEV